MVRYTKKDIERLCGQVNEELAKTAFSLRIGYRYNYKALDLYKDGKCHSTLIAGLTTNQIWEWLHAFLKGIYYSHGETWPSRGS